MRSPTLTDITNKSSKSIDGNGNGNTNKNNNSNNNFYTRFDENQLVWGDFDNGTLDLSQSILFTNHENIVRREVSCPTITHFLVNFFYGV